MTKFNLLVIIFFSFQLSSAFASRNTLAETADHEEDLKTDENYQQTKALNEEAEEPVVRAYGLNDSDREILRRGEMPTNQYVVGGLVGTFVGFGIGEAVQSRYYPTGLIITLGEVTGLTMMTIGVVNCVDSLLIIGSNNRTNCSSGLLTAGWVVFAGLRLWEIIDVWAMPPMDDTRYRELRSRGFKARTSFGVFPVASKSNEISGAGLSLKIEF